MNAAQESTWPERVIDPHIHQWDPYSTPRHTTMRARLLRPIPRIPPALSAFASRADREFIADPQHVLKPYLPKNYLTDAAILPVTTVVHVEAEWLGPTPMDSVDETRWVAALPFGIDDNPSLGAIVVNADPRWTEIGAVLDAHLAASDLVRGVRHSAGYHADGGVRNFETSGDVLDSPAFIDGFTAIAERGLSFELWGYAEQLPNALRLVAEYPETTFVLDHYLTPVGIFGRRGRSTGYTARDRAQMLDRWRGDIASIAACPNVVAKHSGLGMPLLGGLPPRPLDVGSLTEFAERAAPLIRHLHDSFGPTRTMWASNYPMDKPVLTIPATARVLLDVLGSDADRQRLFHDVAATTYRLNPPEENS